MANVTFDNVATKTATNATVVTATVTVGSGSNRAIVAGLAFQSGGTQPASVAVSGAGASGWTLAKNSVTNWSQQLGSGNGFIEEWVATAPATGAQTVSASWTNAATATLIISTFANVSQTTAFGGDTRTPPQRVGSTEILGIPGGDFGYPLTYCSTGEMVVDMVSGDAGTLTLSGGDASQAIAATATTGVFVSGMSYATNTGPLIGSGWTSGNAGTRWQHSSVTLLPTTLTASTGTFLSACGPILSPAAQQTGTQSVVGLGFQPRVVYFYMASQGATLLGVRGIHGVACRDSGGTVHQMVWHFCEDDNGRNPTSDMSAVRTDACCGFADAVNQVWTQLASLSSFDADGFTLNWTTNSTVFATPVYFWAIGGTDIPNANIVTFTDATVTGAKSVTGAGFKPTFAMFYDWGITAALPYLGGTGTGFGYGFGVAKDSTHRWALGGYGQGNVATANTAKELLDNHCHVLMTTAVNNGPTVSADLTSFDADGFTLNYDVVSASAFKAAALLLGGTFQSYVATVTQAASAGGQTITTGFQPVLTGIQATGATATGFNSVDAQVIIGYAASNQQRWSYWTAEVNGNAQNIAHNDTEVNAIVTADTQVAGGATLAASSDFFSSSATGLTVTWTTNDSVARILPVFSFGAAAAATQALGPGMILFQFGPPLP